MLKKQAVTSLLQRFSALHRAPGLAFDVQSGTWCPRSCSITLKSLPSWLAVQHKVYLSCIACSGPHDSTHEQCDFWFSSSDRLYGTQPVVFGQMGDDTPAETQGCNAADFVRSFLLVISC